MINFMYWLSDNTMYTAYVIRSCIMGPSDFPDMYGTNRLQSKCMLRVHLVFACKRVCWQWWQTWLHAVKHTCMHKCVLHSYSLYGHLRTYVHAYWGSLPRIPVSSGSLSSVLIQLGILPCFFLASVYVIDTAWHCFNNRAQTPVFVFSLLFPHHPFWFPLQLHWPRPHTR